MRTTTTGRREAVKEKRGEEKFNKSNQKPPRTKRAIKKRGANSGRYFLEKMCVVNGQVITRAKGRLGGGVITRGGGAGSPDQRLKDAKKSKKLITSHPKGRKKTLGPDETLRGGTRGRPT